MLQRCVCESIFIVTKAIEMGTDVSKYTNQLVENANPTVKKGDAYVVETKARR